MWVELIWNTYIVLVRIRIGWPKNAGTFSSISEWVLIKFNVTSGNVRESLWHEPGRGSGIYGGRRWRINKKNSFILTQLLYVKVFRAASTISATNSMQSLAFTSRPWIRCWLQSFDLCSQFERHVWNIKCDVHWYLLFHSISTASARECTKAAFNLIGKIALVGRNNYMRYKVPYMKPSSVHSQSTAIDNDKSRVRKRTFQTRLQFISIGFFSLLPINFMSRAAATRCTSKIAKPNGCTRRLTLLFAPEKNLTKKNTNLCTISWQPIRVESILFFEIALKSVGNILYIQRENNAEQQRLQEHRNREHGRKCEREKKMNNIKWLKLWRSFLCKANKN